jgi:hypothetical protein
MNPNQRGVAFCGISHDESQDAGLAIGLEAKKNAEGAIFRGKGGLSDVTDVHGREVYHAGSVVMG